MPERDQRVVSEVWLMRNGSRAIITHRREDGVCVGHIEESDAIHCWVYGITSAGRGYDLIEQTPPAIAVVRTEEGKDA